MRVRVDKTFSKDEGEGGWNKAIYHPVWDQVVGEREGGARGRHERTSRSNKAWRDSFKERPRSGAGGM